MPVMLISSSLFLRKSGSRWDDWPGGKFLPSLACSTALPRLCLSSLDLRNNGSIPLHYLQLGIAATDQFNNLIILQVTVSAFWHRRHDNQCPEVWTINQQGVGVLLLPSSSHHCSSSNWRGRSLRLQWLLPPTAVLQLQCWLMTLATSLYLSTNLYFTPISHGSAPSTFIAPPSLRWRRRRLVGCASVLLPRVTPPATNWVGSSSPTPLFVLRPPELEGLLKFLSVIMLNHHNS